MVSQDQELLIHFVLADWNRTIDSNILMVPSTSAADYTKLDVKPRAFSDVDDFTWDLVDQLNHNLKFNATHFKSPVEKTDCLNQN
eukprot:1787000-Prorocentrum_lima.AAC.1